MSGGPYTVESEHVAELRRVADRLLVGPVSPAEGRELAVAVMSVVRYAEALEALRGPGEPYVHILPRKKEPPR